MRIKQTPRKEDKKMKVDDFVKEPSKWGVQLRWHLIDHQDLHQEMHLGCCHTKVCHRIFKMYCKLCIVVICTNVKDIEDM